MKEQIPVFVFALFVAACALVSASPATAPGVPNVVPATDEVILTQNRHTACVEIPAGSRSTLPSLLEVPITRIMNPAQTPVSIFVYLVWPATQTDSTDKQKILLGNFSVFPADRAGTYVVRVSDGFRRLEAMGVHPEQGHVALRLELRRISEAKAWTPIELRIAPLRWRAG